MQQLQSSETLFDITLKFDLNHLLMLFNEMDRNSTGEIQKKHLKIIMESLNIQENEFFDSATFMSNDTFEFDAMLSILGEI
jgi:Ca2+-binding EF-hand superfamily protein